MKNLPKGDYTSLEKAGIDAIKLIKKFSDGFYVKAFILEYHTPYIGGFTVEKISRDYNKDTQKSGYYCEIEGKRTYRYKVNASKGTLGDKVKRTVLV